MERATVADDVGRAPTRTPILASGKMKVVVVFSYVSRQLLDRIGIASFGDELSEFELIPIEGPFLVLGMRIGIDLGSKIFPIAHGRKVPAGIGVNADPICESDRCGVPDDGV